ncbi:hypothetical protein HDV03_000289 [Kappamyces sp. JEL0829]|nr:hypothetical protein HDV03_000289 [Kappamyces sp. JEL0829]
MAGVQPVIVASDSGCFVELDFAHLESNQSRLATRHGQVKATISRLADLANMKELRRRKEELLQRADATSSRAKETAKEDLSTFLSRLESSITLEHLPSAPGLAPSQPDASRLFAVEDPIVSNEPFSVSACHSSDAESNEDSAPPDQSTAAHLEAYEAAIRDIRDPKTLQTMQHLLSQYKLAVQTIGCLGDYIAYTEHCKTLDQAALQLEMAKVPPSASATEVFAIGQNDDGQLGVPALKMNCTGKFRRVALDGPQIVSLACGSLFALALDSTGTLFSWGFEECIGRDGPEDSPLPVQFPTANTLLVTRIACGEYIGACIDHLGRVWTWGGWRNAKGDRLDRHDRPRLVSFPRDEVVVDISAGESHLVALSSTGQAFTWGVGEYGQLGRPPAIELAPVQVVLPSPASRVFACGFSTFFATPTGLYGCGKNGFGELGIGHSSPAFHPVTLSLAAPVTKVVGGIHHTLFLDALGRVWASGKNQDGQCGLPPSCDFVLTPRLVDTRQTAFPAKDIVAGTSSHHSYLIDNDCNLFVCGQNEYSQCGRDADSVFTFQMADLKGRKCELVGGGCQFSVAALGPRPS